MVAMLLSARLAKEIFEKARLLTMNVRVRQMHRIIKRKELMALFHESN